MHNETWCFCYIPSLRNLYWVVLKELQWQNEVIMTDGVTQLLDLLPPLATQVNINCLIKFHENCSKRYQIIAQIMSYITKKWKSRNLAHINQTKQFTRVSWKSVAAFIDIVGSVNDNNTSGLKRQAYENTTNYTLFFGQKELRLANFLEDVKRSTFTKLSVTGPLIASLNMFPSYR